MAEEMQGMGDDVAITRAKRKDLMQLIERQEYRCALTGIALDPSNAELDHIQPVSRGGGHSISNLQVVTSEVNRMKGTLNNDEFVELCRQVVAWIAPLGERYSLAGYMPNEEN